MTWANIQVKIRIFGTIKNTSKFRRACTNVCPLCFLL